VIQKISSSLFLNLPQWSEQAKRRQGELGVKGGLDFVILVPLELRSNFGFIETHASFLPSFLPPCRICVMRHYWNPSPPPTRDIRFASNSCVSITHTCIHSLHIPRSKQIPANLHDHSSIRFAMCFYSMVYYSKSLLVRGRAQAFEHVERCRGRGRNGRGIYLVFFFTLITHRRRFLYPLGPPNTIFISSFYLLIFFFLNYILQNQIMRWAFCEFLFFSTPCV
jgi:hypothetical protein